MESLQFSFNSFLIQTFLNKMTRNFFVGGNWKMNGSKATIDTITDGLNATKVPEGVEGNS